MPIQVIAALLLILSARWVYILAKRFDKPRIKYAVFAGLIYLLGGSVLTFIFTFILLMMYGEFAFNYEAIMASSLTLLGALSVGIYYLILRRIWSKKKQKAPNQSTFKLKT